MNMLQKIVRYAACFAGLSLLGCTAQPVASPTAPATIIPTASVTPPAPPTATAPVLLAATPAPTVGITPSPMNTKNLIEPLIQAAEKGDVAQLQRLLKDGAPLNGQDARGRTAAMAATHGNQPDALRALIQAGADINLRDNRSDNPFLYAGAEGLLDILKLTIEAKADTKLTNRYGGTALIPAAERGHVAVVSELLKRTDVNVNHINHLGWTALLEAIVLSNGGERHQQIVQLLIEHGADVNIADKEGVTPLAHAQRRGYKEIAQLLQKAGARVEAQTTRLSPAERDKQLILAARAGNLEQVKQLLAQGASVTTRDDSGATALIAAAYRNQVAIAELLIKAGADVNVQDNTKQSAYLIPTADGYVELLRLTLRSGANVHSTDSYNGTGLIRAADRGHVEVIRELLKTDIKLDHVNRLGWTALLEAIILGDGGPRHTEVVRLLIEAGANINIADSGGVTPLAHAKRRGQTQIIKLLEAAGAK